MFDDAVDWIGKHPIATGAIVVGGGLVVLYLLGFFGGSSGGGSSGGGSSGGGNLAGAYYGAEQAQTAAGAQVQSVRLASQAATRQTQIAARSTTNQARIGADAGVSINRQNANAATTISASQTAAQIKEAMLGASIAKAHESTIQSEAQLAHDTANFSGALNTFNYQTYLQNLTYNNWLRGPSTPQNPTAVPSPLPTSGFNF